MRRLLLLVLTAALLTVVAPSARAVDDPARSKQWNLDQIRAEQAWAAGDGSGIVVAVLDSGVDLGHEDLAGRLVPGRDFVDDDDVPQDAYGHGTHVAGIVAAGTGNGRGVSGVAPGAKVMPVRVLDAEGAGTLDDVIAGVRWAVAHDADVLNLSLGEDTQALLGPRLGDVISEAWDAGVVPVVSAGNQFLTGSGFRDEPALVVAATDRAGGKPSYSSGTGAAQWGIAAPGGELPDLGPENAVLSTYWTGQQPNRYAYLAGTSQAAPHVAGAVAVLLSTGRFTPRQVVDRLLGTARDAGPRGKDATFGAGVLDLGAATEGLRPASAGAPSAGDPQPRPAPARPPAASVVPAPPSTVPGPGPTGGTSVPAGESTTTTAPTEGSEEVALPDRRPKVQFDERGSDGEAPGTEGPAPWIASALVLLVAGAGLRQRRLPA